jgi:APA family basic amino acid/polyamine antiporter
MIMGLAFCVLLIIFKPKFTWPGLIITLIGIPVYYLIKGNIARQDSKAKEAVDVNG